MNRLCDLLQIERPILQAPVGSIAGPELCAAVSEAGALGAMGATWKPKAELLDHIRQVKARTSRPFQINYALHFEPETLEAALDEGVPVVTFSWGSPAPWMERLRRYEVKVGVQVGSAAGAAYMASIGVDFIVLQGVEAGGHVQAHQPLSNLLAELKELEIDRPAVAAGGLATSEDVRRVIEQGAEGAMLGTRFVASQESRAHETYKRLLLEAGPDATALTLCFDRGWPTALHRVLRNATFQVWEAAGCPPSGKRWGEDDIVARSSSGEPIYRYEDTAPREGMVGEIDDMCLYAGTGAAAIDDVPAAGDLVRRLWLVATPMPPRP